MGSSKKPKKVFTPEELHALDLALMGALATAKELGVDPKVLKGALRRRLFAAARAGITDPQALRNEALKSMNVDKLAR